MPALNRVQIIGNLGKDPETRVTPNGKKVTTFSVAVNSHWRDDAGEQNGSTEWFNIEAWERQAEICEQYLHKGSLVYIEGRLQTRRYEQNGETKYFTKVVMQNIQMLDRKSQETEYQPQVGDAAF